MNINNLSLLRCPFCLQRFTIGMIIKKFQTNILVGSVYCRCDEYPILCGILYLHKDSAPKIINMLQKKREASGFLIAAQRDNLLHAASRFPIAAPLFYRIHNPACSTKIPIQHYRYIWRYLLNRTAQDYKYYFNRNLFISSLLFFFPLGLIHSEEKIAWLDIGSGIFTYYSALQRLRPNITIISTETNFMNLCLSQLYFSAESVIRVCADINYGPIIKQGSASVVTFIDSLYCTPRQKQSIEAITTTGIVKKNGFVFASGLFEHAYWPFETTSYYPISRSVIQKFFPSRVLFFNNERLANYIKRSTATFVPTSCSKNKIPLFRYSVLWPKQIITKWKRFSLPKMITDQSTLMQKDAITSWQNAVY